MSIVAPPAAPLPPPAASSSSSYNEPVTPPTMPRSSISSTSTAMTGATATLPTPPSSIQKYRDALRRDLKIRYEAAARAGRDAKVPADAAHDPDYGYDENPFDTHARLLLSFTDASHAPAAASSYPISPESPPRRKRVLEYPEEQEGQDVAVLDSPAPSIRSTRRRWSYTSGSVSASGSTPASGLASAVMSRSSSLSYCDTPGSDMSFEVGRAADYVGLYGRPSLRVQTSGISPARTPPPPPVVQSATSGHASFTPSPLATVSTSPFLQATPTSTAKERRNSLLGAGRVTPLKPLTQLTPSPQARRSRRRRSRCADAAALDGWTEAVLSRSESETMLLAAAGFASQRSRAGGR